MRNTLGFSADLEIMASNSSRHSEAGYTSCGDTVIWRADDGVICAGQIVAHCAVREAPFSIVKYFDCTAFDSMLSFTTADVMEEYGFVETETILDACAWCQYSTLSSES